MGANFDDAIVQSIRKLYDQDVTARAALDWAASLKKDARSTTIERFTQVLSISRQVAVALAKELENAGCGQFVVGRRGSPSRFEWAYSRISLGLAASGATEEVERVTDLLPEDDDEERLPAQDTLTIKEAKRRLALSLGVEPEQIEIQVRA